MGGGIADGRKRSATAARRPTLQAAAPCGWRLSFLATGSQRCTERCVIATLRRSSLQVPEQWTRAEMAFIRNRKGKFDRVLEPPHDGTALKRCVWESGRLGSVLRLQ